MQQTTNYKLNKIELADSPADITVLNANWDKIDTEMKTLNGKTGGSVTGAVTISGKLTANGGIDAKTLTVTGASTFGSPIKITNPNMIQSQVPVSRGTNPDSMQYSHWSVYDQDGYSTAANRLGRVQYSINSDGTATMAMYVNKFSTVGSEEVAGIIAQWGTDGKAKVSILHDPEQSANDRQLATTKWVKALTATTSQYGLVRLASESDILNETDKTVMDVPLAYELSDFRRIGKAYSVGDKVNCAFKFEYYLECTQAGTTSDESLDTRNVTFGQVITDGTVQWTVRAHVKSVGGKVADANGNISFESFPSGTQLLFYQAAAPTGWAIVPGIEESTVKIVSTGGGVLAGTTNFSDIFTELTSSSVSGGTISGSTDPTTLVVSQMPSHRHSFKSGGTESLSGADTTEGEYSRNGYTSYEGGSDGHTHTFSATVSSHSHTVNLSVKYINVIVCKKD